MGIFSNLGVSIAVQSTLRLGRGDLGDITDSITGWSHTSGAVGGYLTATASINESRAVIDEWLETGLGRWITLYDEGANICWRGFVDQINANIGGLQIQRGPLTGIANRVHMVYSTVDTSTTPPTMGVRATTAQTNDTTSQAKYGIWQKVLSTGGSTAADATQLQAMYLQEYAQPSTTKTLSPGGGGLNMSLQLKGAWYWMGYLATYTTTGTVNLSARLQATLALDPNALFSTDYSQITANTYQVPAYQTDDKTAQKYISELLNPGDAAFNRYTAGFYNSEVMYYQPVPTVIEYQYSLSDPAQEITIPSGTTVTPWAVLPAKWLTIPDLMVGRVPDTDLRDDPRNLFIEQVTYTAPYSVQINGSKVGTLAQVLAQKGLSGLGS